LITASREASIEKDAMNSNCVTLNDLIKKRRETEKKEVMQKQRAKEEIMSKLKN